MTRSQARVVLGASIVVALTRLLAIAKSPWDWDELLFMLSMRDYDVGLHHPHPPGFPLYVAMAKLARFFTSSDFSALQLVNVLAACSLFPAMFFLAREARFRFVPALIAALYLCFFPDVWFFGGTAFSDVPSIALVIIAVALLLRGCRSPRAFLLGSVVLGCAMGIRSQNALVGTVPFLLAAWCRRKEPRRIAAAVFAIVAIVVICYGAAAWATGSWQQYAGTVKAHKEYIATHDSFLAPGRPSLHVLFGDFFLRQYQKLSYGYVISLLVLVSAITSVVTRRKETAILAMAFGPFCLLAWLMLDRYSISRFAIGYAPLFAALAADGTARVGAWSARGRGDVVSLGFAVVLSAAFAIWTLPALNITRTTLSPPVAAVDWIRAHAARDRSEILTAFGMKPFAEYYLPDYESIYAGDPSSLSLALPPAGKQRFLLSEGKSRTTAFFTRPRTQLWKITRRRYFDVFVRPAGLPPAFGEGWYEAERSPGYEWRWMAQRSILHLDGGGKRDLTLDVEFPEEQVSRGIVMDVVLNGRRIDRFKPSEITAIRRYKLTPADTRATNVCEISVSSAMNAGGRQLGLKLWSISWSAAQQAQ